MECSRCHKEFIDHRTPEEKLIQALFGEILCKDCFENKDSQPCSYCGETVLAPISYNDKPYHSKCIAEELGL